VTLKAPLGQLRAVQGFPTFRIGETQPSGWQLSVNYVGQSFPSGAEPFWVYLTCVDNTSDGEGTPGPVQFQENAITYQACGNQVLEYPEQCDGGEGCDSVCNFSQCGNGAIESAEQCDDGNLLAGDGCSASCGTEPGYYCSGQPSTCVAQQCGNGQVEGTESCDDFNTIGGDGCDADCSVEPGYECSGTPSVCTSFGACGDGQVDGTEACDDGNLFSGDGCATDCQVEAGYQCTGQPSVCTSAAACGNGITEFPAEDCDIGIPGSAVYCDSECKFIPGNCGDGSRGPYEGCDDGNLNNGDGCTNTCTPEPGYTCFGDLGQLSNCQGAPQVCGNGAVEGTEQCDDGDTADQDGCDSNCQIEDGYECSGQPSTCTVP